MTGLDWRFILPCSGTTMKVCGVELRGTNLVLCKVFESFRFSRVWSPVHFWSLVDCPACLRERENMARERAWHAGTCFSAILRHIFFFSPMFWPSSTPPALPHPPTISTSHWRLLAHLLSTDDTPSSPRSIHTRSTAAQELLLCSCTAKCTMLRACVRAYVTCTLLTPC
jgi:hypothetical protein